MNAPDLNTPSTPARKPVAILVAEDSPVNRALALKQLEKLGYAPQGVADGAEALAAIERAAFDIILMDCNMPEVSGYEATWQIREAEKKQAAAAAGPPRRVYIIAMTADAEADSRAKCRDAGMDDFVNKPVQLPELEAALQRALADRVTQQALDEVIDPVAIAALRQLRMPQQADPLAELIDLFLREAPGHLDILGQSVTSTAAEAVARALRAASALTGSASNLGARNLAALADELVQAIRTGYLADSLPLVDKARQEFERVRLALNKIKGEATGP
jgi:CheY-like chemotaxis protein/HPt (histidine-containing phosphotransfer) domain-containing protein